MSFGVPWALAGLAALPLIWWLHRRLRRPPEQLLPSLMFLQDEDETRALPRGRRLDAELLLALSAACLLALAAAGPRIVHARAHRVIRVVVSGGTAATSNSSVPIPAPLMWYQKLRVAAAGFVRSTHGPTRNAVSRATAWNGTDTTTSTRFM